MTAAIALLCAAAFIGVTVWIEGRTLSTDCGRACRCHGRAAQARPIADWPASAGESAGEQTSPSAVPAVAAPHAAGTRTGAAAI